MFELDTTKDNCPACGHLVLNTIRYCTSCGADIHYWLGGLNPSNYIIQMREEEQKISAQRAKEDKEYILQQNSKLVQLQAEFQELHLDSQKNKKQLKYWKLLITLIFVFVFFESLFFIIK